MICRRTSTRKYSQLVYVLVCVFLLLHQNPAWSQQVDELVLVKAAMTNGDARKLMTVASDRVELALLGASRQYSRSQASLVLRKFFEQYRPRSFEIVDSTQSNKGIFLEGRIRLTDSDKLLRAYLRLNQADGHWTLRELLIERADS